MKKAFKILEEAGYLMNEAVKVKKGQSVIHTKSGKDGKIDIISGSGAIVTIELTDGSGSIDISANSLKPATGKYKDKFDYMFETSEKLVEVKLSKVEMEFINNDLMDAIADHITIYSKSRLLKDMVKNVGDDSFDSPEARAYIKTASKKMIDHIQEFKG